MDRATGDTLWHYTTTGTNSDLSGAPADHGSLLVLADAMGHGFFALRKSSGQFAWRVPTAVGWVGPSSTPAFADGKVFAGAQGGVYAADLASGSIAWSRESVLGGDDVAPCGSVLLVQNQQITTLDLASGQPRGGSWLDFDSTGDFPTSYFAVNGNRAVVVGNKKVYGILCPT